MGKYFSDVVEKALKDIYYDVTTGRGKESFQLLEKASAKEMEMRLAFWQDACMVTNMCGEAMIFQRIVTGLRH